MTSKVLGSIKDLPTSSLFPHRQRDTSSCLLLALPPSNATCQEGGAQCPFLSQCSHPHGAASAYHLPTSRLYLLPPRPRPACKRGDFCFGPRCIPAPAVPGNRRCLLNVLNG